MSNQQYEPTTDDILRCYMQRGGSEEEFNRWYEAELSAAEQRGAEKAFRKAQEIIAGFEHTIDEARNRDDMINTGYLIQEIDTEIQDLTEDDDETH